MPVAGTHSTGSTAEEPIGARVRSALAWSAAGGLSLRIGNLAVGVLLARLLAPEQFGIFAIALTVQAVVMALADLGMSADIIRNGHEGRQGTVTTLAVVFSGLLTLTTWLLAEPLAVATGTPGATAVVQVMALTFILSGLSVVPFGVMQREFRQSTQTAIDGVNLVVGTVVTVVLVLLGMGAMALAVSRVVAQALSTVLQYVAVSMWPVFGFDRALVGDLMRFGLPLAVSNLVSWLAMSTGQIVVAGVADATALAFYVLAFNISMWPMTGLGMVVRAVALPAFSRLDDPDRRAAAFVSASSLTWGLGLLAAIGLSATAAVLVPFVYGEPWTAAAAALAGLAFFGAVRMLYDMFATYLIAVGETRAVFTSQVLWAAVLLPAAWIGWNAAGLAGVAVAQAVVSAVVVLPYFLVLLRRHGVDVAFLLRRLARPVLSAVPALLAGLGVIALTAGAPRPVQLIAATAVITGAYLLTSLGWFRSRRRDLGASDNASASPVPREDH